MKKYFLFIILGALCSRHNAIAVEQNAVMNCSTSQNSDWHEPPDQFLFTNEGFYYEHDANAISSIDPAHFPKSSLQKIKVTANDENKTCQIELPVKEPGEVRLTSLNLEINENGMIRSRLVKKSDALIERVHSLKDNTIPFRFDCNIGRKVSSQEGDSADTVIRYLQTTYPAQMKPCRNILSKQNQKNFPGPHSLPKVHSSR